jgi:hypothetical protein
MNKRQYYTANMKSFEYYSEHFRMRLLQRYNISITAEEYIILCKQKIRVLYPLTVEKRFGILNIKGIDVYIIKNKFVDILNTAILLENNFYPVPLRLIRQGVSAEDFTNTLNDALNLIKSMSKVLATMTKRDFFINQPGGYEFWIYSAAYNINRPNITFTWTNIIDNLYGRRSNTIENKTAICKG